MKIPSPQAHYDVVVIGGGMVGASFACALNRARTDKALSILVVEAVAQDSDDYTQPSFDARSTALSFGSRQIYQAMGLWSQLDAVVTPIKEIHVSDRGRFGSARIDHAEQKVDALGYVIENARLGLVLNAGMEDSSEIHFLCPALITGIKPNPDGMSLGIRVGEAESVVETSLVVLADGGKSPISSQLGIERSVENYGQHALIANVAFELPHNNVAYERFTDTGPLAVLPLESFDDQQRGSLVWSVAEEQSAEFMALNDEELLARLQQRFGDRLGRFTHIGNRFCYPLTLSLAKEQVRPGLVLLGNVAHTLHPVAGQGLNLALRDIAALVSTLTEALEAGKALGEMAVLQKYLERQDFDQQKAIAFTDYMTWLFSSNSQAKVLARKVGLLSLNLLPPLKRGFAGQAMGFK